MLVTSRAALGGNDHIDWSDLGPVGTSIADPLFITSAGGLAAMVDQFGTNAIAFRRVDQNNGWNGNFAPGDELVLAPCPFCQLDITFAEPVFGMGMQFEADLFGAVNTQFVVSVTAFDSGGHALAGATVFGDTNSNADNSAVFLGLLDSSASIARLRFDVYDSVFFERAGVAMNQMDLVTSRVVPEPSTVLLLAAGLAGLRSMRSRPRRP